MASALSVFFNKQRKKQKQTQSKMSKKTKVKQKIIALHSIGFNVEKGSTENWRFRCWDVGGADKISMAVIIDPCAPIN